ncbi:MAG: UDP-N-acetylmuramate--L-alanine ligase [Bacteroidales bacterium]|nr:UDP-N-acetylmuramate--L-alanine ligase [Bacteroidales bacterium]
METKQIYFVGAGGIGMAALERYYLAKGQAVAGYDRTPSELTDALEKEGVIICFEDDPEKAVPIEFRDAENTLVVYTPAIPSDNRVLGYFRANGFNIVKRAALLGEITRDSKALCFAGTHGKTTTSSMAAHIMHNCKAGCNAFLGGVLRNYNSNYLLDPASDYSVVEADEFDRSFHHLTPYVAVITATDPDHLDIYGDEEGYLEGFARFTELVRPDGALILHTGLKLKPRPQPGVKVYHYSMTEGDFHAENIRQGNGEIRFDFVYPGGRIDNISLGVPVEINIENAVAALAACWYTGEMEPDKARDAIATFMGPKRRFEFYLKEPGENGRAIIDDYAHHPDELRAAILSVKKLYPGRRLTVAFQPHLYSRTRDFYREFAGALSLADEVILLPIYPAREEPIAGVSSEMVYNLVTTEKKLLERREDLIDTAKNCNFEILLTAGAGDIVLLTEKLSQSIIDN